MEWKKSQNNTDAVKSLIKKYNIDGLAASIFYRRGITSSDDLFFFLEYNTRYLHSPFEFLEMSEAIARIVSAYEDREKILVFGDRDVDGITATTIMVKALKKLGCECEWAVPVGDEAYGITTDVIDKYSEQGVTLIITVDCGISNASEIEYAASLGIDVIVTDHHNPPSTLPSCVALINAKLEDSGYPYEKICGCATAFKVALALEIAKSPIYNHSYTLLNVTEENGTFTIEAVILENLVVVDRCKQIIVSENFSLASSPLRRFLVGKEIVVFEEKISLPLLKKCFGSGVDIALTEFAPKLWSKFPKLSGVSLFRLKDLSTIAKYQENGLSEIDLFLNLFLTYTIDNLNGYNEAIYDYIDLVAFGTLADQMPLKNENRLFVKLGLDKINGNYNFLNGTKSVSLPVHALLYQQNLLGKPVTATDLAWSITPMINATGRMGVAPKAVEYLLSDSTDLSFLQSKAKEISEINEARKKEGAEVWDRFLPIAKKSYESLGKRFVIIGSKEIPRGVTGYLSNRLMEFFKAPAMVVSANEQTRVGSLRTFSGLNAKLLLEEFSSYLNDFGGHDCAAGFNMNASSWESFYNDFCARVMKLDESLPQESINIDATLPQKFLNPELINLVDQFAPYGEENPPLTFEASGVLIENIELLGKQSSDHVRLTINSGDHKWVALFWNAASRVGIDFNKGDKVDILFQLTRNFFRGNQTLQLMIQDIRRS